MPKVGVLAVQGSVQEHLNCLSMIEGVIPVAVKTTQDIISMDALILPGGESSAIGKIISDFSLNNAILELDSRKAPIWGTCAGMILLAKGIIGESVSHLKLMDIRVKRNAYGSQLDSFIENVHMPEVAEGLHKLVFIRAPLIEEVGNGVKVLATVKGKAVAAKQDNLLATSFHPELTEDLSFYKYFAAMIQKGTNYNAKFRTVSNSST